MTVLLNPFAAVANDEPPLVSISEDLTMPAVESAATSVSLKTKKNHERFFFFELPRYDSQTKRDGSEVIQFRSHSLKCVFIITTGESLTLGA